MSGTNRFPPPRAGEHLCWQSSIFGRDRLPGPVLSDKGICQQDEFSGDGDECGFGSFPIGQETAVESLHVAAALGSTEGCEIEHDGQQPGRPR